MKHTLTTLLLTVAIGLGTAIPATANAGPACEAFCSQAHAYFLELCESADEDPWLCSQQGQLELDDCIARQCQLEVQVPGLAGLTSLAERITADRIGAEFSVSSVELHCYNTDSCDPGYGSWVFTLETADGERNAFLELGASLYLEPILSWGIETRPPADELAEEITSELEAVYGGGPWVLQRRFLSAPYPILEYSDGVMTVFYSVANDTTADAFELTVDPDADQDAEAIRLEANKARWQQILETYSY